MDQPTASLLPPARVRTVFDGSLTEPQLDHPEGIAVHEDGSIWCGGERGQIYRLSADFRHFEQVGSTGGFCLGMAFGADGNLFICDQKQAAVMRFVTATGEVERWADGVPGQRFSIPNFPAFDGAGRLYVSDSHAFRQPGPGIFRFTPDGDGELWYGKDVDFANGLAFSPGARYLYVAETFARRIFRIPVREDGTPGAREDVVRLGAALPDGLAFDAQGNLYVGCYEPSQILRVDSAGRVATLFHDAEAHLLAHPTNLAFRGSTMLAANLGRWHITALDVGITGLPLLPGRTRKRPAPRSVPTGATEPDTAIPAAAGARWHGPARSETGGEAKTALRGVRVLDFTQMMMGPWATQFLGDMGAEVIKIERPGAGEWERGLRAAGRLHGGQSPFFLAMNRNKKSVALNLKDDRARQVLLQLAATCDLVTENFRPGVLDRLGLGYDDLRKVNSSIVYVSGSGYGPDGPYAGRPGQDLLIQALSGLAAYGGRHDDPPIPCGSSIVDASTALLLAHSAMVALFHRERTGQGQKVEVNLFATAVALQCQEFTAFLNSGDGFERSEAGIGGAWLAAPFGIYRTADGWIALAMMPLAVLGDLLGMPELAAYDEPGRAFSDRDEVKRLLDQVLVKRRTAEWTELLGSRDLWCAPVQDFHDLERDPQVEHAGLIQAVAHPGGGTIRVVGPPAHFSETPGTIRTGPPAVGEHTDEVLRSLGYSDEQIRALHADGVA